MFWPEETVSFEKKEFTKFDLVIVKESKISKIMKYILTHKEAFIVKNIKNQFPKANYRSIYDSISYLIEAGKIKHIGGAKPRIYAVVQDE